MSYGKMNGFLTVLRKRSRKDEEGFTSDTFETVAITRCYREGRHGSVRWANLASFSEATDLFRIRCIPGLDLSADYTLDFNGERFKPLSVENVKGRGMYIEILAKHIEGTVS